MSERVSEQVIHSVTFDLWGYSAGWVERIGNAIGECYEGDTDTCEQHDVPQAGIEQVVFTSTDPKQIERVKRTFARMSNLAKRTDRGINHNR